MAITPREAKERASLSTAELKRLETIVDKAIIERTRQGLDETTITTAVFPNTAARNTIIDTYRTAGWDVTYHSDWHEGDYLSISPKKGDYRHQTHLTIDDYR